MKIIIQDNRRYLLRFDKGEELIESLATFATQQGILAASFSAIGTALEVELGFYNSHLKEYRRKPFVEDLEVDAIVGDISALDGKPFAHAHGTFNRTDFTTIGGHIFRLVVNATCEVNLIKLEGTAARAKNDEFNLNLLS